MVLSSMASFLFRMAAQQLTPPPVFSDGLSDPDLVRAIMSGALGLTFAAMAFIVILLPVRAFRADRDHITRFD